jgi:zinc/manganese transport system substrate-binding protein
MPLLVLLLLPANGCNQSNSPPQSQTQDASAQSQQLKVVATFLPMYWFTKAVAGDLARVEVLIPPGTEVHEYQATPKNVQAIAQADVLVKNGLGLEEFLESTVKNAQNTQLNEIDSSKGIKTLEETSPVVKPGGAATDANHEGENAGESHEHEAGNPHVWLDPVRAKQQVANIRDGLIAADPQNKATYQANAGAYIKQLEALDREFKQRLQQDPKCTFVTFHDAYPYLANRYQLKQVAVVEIPEDQLSPADVQKTVDTVKQYKVKALFGEPGVDNKLLQGLSQDLNLTLRPLDPLESGPLDPQHYFMAMKANLQTLESACR